MLKLLPALALLTAAQPQQPAPPSPRPAPAVRPWQVDWGRYYCSLIRKPGDGRPFSTAFVETPGSAYLNIQLVGERGTELPTGLDSIVLLPSGRSLPVEVAIADGRRGAMRSIYGLPADFRALLLAASALQLRSGDQVRATVPLDGIRSAMAAQRRCTSEVAREWGIDEAAQAALSRRARTTNHLGLRPEDYPAAALRRATQGRVIMRLTINTEGRATECVPVATSGSPEIDRTACSVAMARGRFEPGLDGGGRPVETREIHTVTFYLPRD